MTKDQERNDLFLYLYLNLYLPLRLTRDEPTKDKTTLCLYLNLYLSLRLTKDELMNSLTHELISSAPPSGRLEAWSFGDED